MEPYPPSAGEGLSSPRVVSPPGEYGLRQNVDLTKPTFLYYAERVIRHEISHFKDHPAIIGYQIDNETHPTGFPTRNMNLLFVDYLKKKFGAGAAVL